MKKRPLPNRRIGYTQKVSIEGKTLYLRTGEYEDGELGEIFLTLDKEGSTLGCMISAFAICLSVGLQHGVPLEEYTDKFLFARFKPNGPVQGDARIKQCDSILDYVCRDLLSHYKGREDLVHVKEVEDENS
jgi:ribonucleoside-diphosphate reductase alpha chain